jgi:o-succinylbenzoate---CoA ligase
MATPQLSIFSAAIAAPDDLAIISDHQTWSFAQCATAAQALHGGSTGLWRVNAEPDVDTILQIYAALQAEIPLVLMHHQLTESQHQAQWDQVIQVAQSLPATTAAIVFTSGSTGTPKGVVLSRQALQAAVDMNSAHLGWQANDRWLLSLPLAHMGGFMVVLRCLAARRPVILSKLPIAQAAVQHQATLMSLVPTQLYGVLPQAGLLAQPPLRAILLGGAAADRSVVQEAIGRGLPVLTSYGATETCGQVVTAKPQAEQGGIGVTLPGVAITAGTKTAPQAIRISSPSLFDGYLHHYIDRAQLQAPSLPNLRQLAPPCPRWFTTSDLGYMEGEQLYIVGRADDMFISGGENVHPATVEQVLTTTTGVSLATVFGVADSRWGHITCAALVVDDSFSVAAAQQYWQGQLAPFQWPRQIALVAALPTNINGKIDRQQCLLLARNQLTYDNVASA